MTNGSMLAGMMIKLRTYADYHKMNAGGHFRFEFREYRQFGAETTVPQTPSRRVSASPNFSSFTPIRSMIERYKLDIFRWSSPASR